MFTLTTNKRGGEVKITYKNKKIEKECTNVKTSDKIYGKHMTEKIHMRIDQIASADTIEMMIQYHIGRCHSLANNRKGQYAMDLVHPYRLVFEKMEMKFR